MALGKRSIERALQKVLGRGANVNEANPLEVHDPKVGSLISYEGITTTDGAGDGSHLIDSVLTTKADYNGNLVIITSGAYDGQARDINGTTTDGTVTPNSAFSGQILSGTSFVIVGIRTTPAEVAALAAVLGAKNTAAATGAVSNIKAVMAYVKQLVTELIVSKAVGKPQMAATTIELDQVAGDKDLFLGTDQDVVVEKLVIRIPVDVSGGAMTSLSIQTDDTTNQVFIDATTGAKANLTAQAQLAWTGAVLIKVGKKIQLTIAGAATGIACSCDVIAECRAVVAGGYLG